MPATDGGRPPTPDRPTSRAMLGAWVRLLAANAVLAALIGYLYVIAAAGVQGAGPRLFLHVAWLSNFTILYTVLGLLLMPVVLAVRRPAVIIAAAPLLALLQVLVFVDATVFRVFKFHLNGMVFNLFVTEGSWDSVHPGVLTVLTGLSVAAGLAVFEWRAARAALRYAAAPRDAPPDRRRARLAIALLVALVLADKVGYATADLLDAPALTRHGRVFPLYRALTVKRAAEKWFGFSVARDRPVAAVRAGGLLNYPLEAPRFTPAARHPNLLVIVLDAWRYDMLAPAETPSILAFAESALVFRNHYSGGNATRFGVFSLLYGLYGSYWHSVLSERRSPVLIDELARLGYAFRIVSSTRLTYPEFRKTAFAGIPGAVVDTFDGQGAEARDAQIVADLSGWLRRRDEGRPFFACLFFDASHGPYAYPLAFDRFQPSRRTPNYVFVGREDVAALKNSYRNAILYNDSLVGTLLKDVASLGLLEETIVLITGDHGEEFMERGYMGHTSAFSPEQVRVPLILRIPGRGHRVVDELTSHADVAPTLLGLLGCTTDPAAYCHGRDLLSAAPAPFVVSSGWDTSALISPPHTIVFSTESYNSGVFEVRDSEYRPVADPHPVLEAQRAALSQVFRGMGEFLR